MPIQHLVKGQPDWQEPINNLIDQYNNLFGDDSSTLRWVDITNQLQYLNGISQTENKVTAKMGYLRFPDKTILVNLTVMAWITPGGSITTETKLMTIPQNLAPIRSIISPANYYGHSLSEIASDGGLYLNTAGDSDSAYMSWAGTYIAQEYN